MRPDNRKEAFRWLAQAEEEIKDVEFLMNAKRYYLSLFLCQQSAEKALKAYIYFKEEEHLHTHSVSDLIKLASEIDSDFSSIKSAKRLDDYYIPTRYPNGLPGDIPAKYYDDPEEVKRALNLSKEIIKLVKSKIH
ncbi:MAG: HEPN domain-containing protein [Candidatus Poribacteria bacterium]